MAAGHVNLTHYMKKEVLIVIVIVIAKRNIFKSIKTIVEQFCKKLILLHKTELL